MYVQFKSSWILWCVYNLETIAYDPLIYRQFKSSYIESFDICRIENEIL